MTKPVPCPPAPGPLEDYAAGFDDLFTRVAQRRGFREYLAGLLAPRHRNKTLTALAGAEPVTGARGLVLVGSRQLNTRAHQDQTPRSGAPGRVTARSPWPGRGSRSPRHGPRPAPTSVPVRPAPAATRHGRLASGPGAPVGRLDPLADRHPPVVPAAFRKLDAVAVLTGPLLPAHGGAVKDCTSS